MGCTDVFGLLAATTFVLAASLCGQQQPQAAPPLSAGALVAAFDEQLQVRFLDKMLGFGMSRLCGPIGSHGALAQTGKSLRKLPQPGSPAWRDPQCGGRDWAPFRPRNSQERWVDSEIKRAKLEIMTLLVGGVRRTLEGPVVVGNDDPTGLDEVRRQLLPRIAQTPIGEDELKKWKVTVRPVRASRESCLECHAYPGKVAMGGPPRIKNLKLQDPLGFLVYLYRQRQ